MHRQREINFIHYFRRNFILTQSSNLERQREHRERNARLKGNKILYRESVVVEFISVNYLID